jgi:hypothetical protein
LGRGDDFGERTRAVAAEKRVYMDHAFIFRETGSLLWIALRLDLIESCA